MATTTRKRKNNTETTSEDVSKRKHISNRKKCVQRGTKSPQLTASIPKALTEPAPFSHDPAAEIERARIDFSIHMTTQMALEESAGRPARVYADGVYDMFHSGHARQLMQAKKAFPNVYLIVGACSDKLTYKSKGKTVMNEEERYEAIRHCRYVDEVLPEAPWSISPEFIEKYKIDFVAHDDIPYVGVDGQEDIYAFIKRDGRFVTTQRTEGISTTDVIARIIKDYDIYVRRNLSRGYTRKELNVGFMKEKTIQFQEKYESIKGKGKNLIGKVENKSKEIIQKWEENSRDIIGNFLELFGKDGRISSWISEGRIRVARAISPPPVCDDDASTSSRGSHPPTPPSSPPSPTSPPTKRGRLSLASASATQCSMDGYSDDSDYDDFPS